jgi:flagellar basal-body rod modification protein FlgD
MTNPISAMGVSPYATAASGSGVATGTIDPTNKPSNVSTASSTGLSLDPQAFLQLLVAQLQYQDPTSPVDTSTFMDQTAMLSQVQSMTSMQTTLSSMMTAQQLQSATAMIGKSITYTDSNGTVHTGIADGVTGASTNPMLTVGLVSVPLASITGVTAAPTS